MADPIFYRDTKWYYAPNDEVIPPGWCFWDEVWSLGGGPYTSEKECRARLTVYAKHLEESQDD